MLTQESTKALIEGDPEADKEEEIKEERERGQFVYPYVDDDDTEDDEYIDDQP